MKLLYQYVLLRNAGPGEAEFLASTIPALQRNGVARSSPNSPKFGNGTQARLNSLPVPRRPCLATDLRRSCSSGDSSWNHRLLRERTWRTCLAE